MSVDICMQTVLGGVSDDSFHGRLWSRSDAVRCLDRHLVLGVRLDVADDQLTLTPVGDTPHHFGRATTTTSVGHEVVESLAVVFHRQHRLNNEPPASQIDRLKITSSFRLIDIRLGILCCDLYFQNQ